MELQKFIQKKYIRLLNSSKVLKFFFYYHKLFNNKGMKDISFDFSKKKNRLFIVQDIIQKKNYKSYLILISSLKVLRLHMRKLKYNFKICLVTRVT